jgi:hypothetical protein
MHAKPGFEPRLTPLGPGEYNSILRAECMHSLGNRQAMQRTNPFAPITLIQLFAPDGVWGDAETAKRDLGIRWEAPREA